jgi:hypothetical protein
MEGARVIKQMIKLVLWPDHICFNTREHSITTSSNLLYHLITFFSLPEHFSSPLNQTCFISWSHLFYHRYTFHYHLIKLVSSPDHICFITRAPSIPSWSNLFHHLMTFVLSPEHLPIPLDHTCFITVDKTSLIKRKCKVLGWWNKCHQLRKQIWPRGNGRCLDDINKCDQAIKQVWSRGNGRCSDDKTSVIRW